MSLKRLALYLLVIGVLALVIGGVIGVTTFNVEEFKEQAEKGRTFIEGTESGCNAVDGLWCESRNECLRENEEACE